MESKQQTLRNHVKNEVEQFFLKNTPEDSCLILDSTGPSLTRHYMVLHEIGVDRLKRFKQVHLFSGGVWAYFGFMAYVGGHWKHEVHTFTSKRIEKGMRDCHHASWSSPFFALFNLIVRKTAFGSMQPITKMLQYYFDDEYLNKQLSDFPKNITVYLGSREAEKVVKLSSVSNDANIELTSSPIGQLVAMGICVPAVYGQPGEKDKYFDVVYSGGYRTALKNVGRLGFPVLVSTPWKEGVNMNLNYLNCFPGVNPKQRMAVDFAKLILNLPNKNYGNDIVDAFGINA